MISAGISGKCVQKDDADAGYGKDSIPENRELQVSFLRAPVVLRQQADCDPDDGRDPDHCFDGSRSGKLWEGELPDVQKKNVENGHRNGGNLKPDSQLSLDFLAASVHGADDSGNQMKGISAAEGQGQNSVKNIQDVSV